MPLTEEDFERHRDLGARRHGESEAQFVERRGAESEARWAEQDAGIAAAKAERARLGLPEPAGGPGYYGIGGHMSASEYAEGGYRICGRAPR